MKEWITGRNAAYEILSSNSRDIFRLFIARGATVKGTLQDIANFAAKRNVMAQLVDRKELDRIDTNHQGMALEVSGFHYGDFDEILARAQQRDEPLFVLLLDLIQNPQNLGTLIRSAEAAGMHGIIIPQVRAAGVTPAVVHASVGATEHIPIVQMNLNLAIRQLQDAGVWIMGLDGGEDSDLIDPMKLDGALGIVVGSEGDGMRRLTRDACDQIIRLPQRGKIESLNAAVAGSIMIYLSYIAHRQS